MRDKEEGSGELTFLTGQLDACRGGLVFMRTGGLGIQHCCSGAGILQLGVLGVRKE